MLAKRTINAYINKDLPFKKNFLFIAFISSLIFSRFNSHSTAWKTPRKNIKMRDFILSHKFIPSRVSSQSN